MSQSFSYFYNETVKIDLEEIKNFLEDQLFVTVGGNNSNSVTERLNLGLPVISLDNYIKESYSRKLFENALIDAFYCKESFMHVGRNRTFDGTKKRLLFGKEFGFTNVLVHMGENDESLNVFNKLKDNTYLVDFYVIVNGR